MKGGLMSAAKLCDSCKSATATVFCRADSAFLCSGCDSKVHAANKLASRHARVWVCEVCEQAPATVTCKADAAHLCPTCDRDIHSANPLARRHERIPLSPFFDPTTATAAAATAAASDNKSSSATAIKPSSAAAISKLFGEEDHYSADDLDAEEAEAASWLLPNPKAGVGMDAAGGGGGGAGAGDPKSIDYLFADDDIDPYLDLDFSSDPKADHNTAAADCVVPDQKGNVHQQQQQQQPPPQSTYFSMPSFHHHHPFEGFDSPANYKPYSLSYAQPALSHSVSSSSLDVGVVPDSSTAAMGEAVSAGTGVPTRGVGVDREARVLRYREKRKNRKFEKTIRYASRKAYAETRPRIKGRFAKRADVVVEQVVGTGVDGFFAADAGYGVVPSF